MRSHGEKRSFVTVAVFVLVFAVLPVGCASLPDRPDFSRGRGYEELSGYLNTYIAKSMKRNKVMGLSIALVDDQELIYARGFGYADQENKVPATKNTVYRVGPISEIFTAMAVMQLAQYGKVDIDAPVASCVPELSIKSRFSGTAPITPRNIMTHHSGLPSDYINGMFTTEPEPLEQFLPRLKEEYTAFPPDLVFSYSRLGMSILGPLIGKVSNKGYAGYMDEEVLMPLGMNNSSFVRGYDFEALIAKSYCKKKPQEQYALRDISAAALYSNVLDLSRFMQMVFAQGRSGDRQILTRETLHEMLRVQNQGCALDMDLKTGLGWMIREKEEVGIIIGQGGRTGSFFSHMFAVPDQKIAAVVLTNCAEGAAVAEGVCMEALKSLYEAKTGRTVPEMKNRAAKAELDEEEMKRYEGDYDTAMGFVSISVEGKKLVAHSRDGLFLLTPRQDGSFSVKYLVFGFIPMEVKPFHELGIAFEDIAGHRFIAGIRENARVLVGTRIDPHTIPPAWNSRLGLYRNTGRGQDGIIVKNIKIRMEKGFLLADVTVVDPEESTVTLALMPVNETQAIVMGMGRNRGDTYTFSVRDKSVMLHAYGYDLLPDQSVQE